MAKRPIRKNPFHTDDPFFRYPHENVDFENREQQYLTQEQITRALNVGQIPIEKVGSVPELTPREKVEVVSTFDTRPINSQDFFKSGGSIAFSTTALANDTETGTFSFQIPAGYVAVLRSFLWGFDPVYVQSTITSVKTGLTIDGQAVKFLDVINDLQAPAQRIPTHLIIDENQILTVTSIRISNIALATRGLTTSDVFFVAEFYGNTLQKRNLPTNFEIGSFK